jgi:hypothetical protein
MIMDIISSGHAKPLRTNKHGWQKKPGDGGLASLLSAQKLPELSL